MKHHHRLFLPATASLLLGFLLPACNKEAKVADKLTTAEAHFAKADYAAAEIEYKNLLELQGGHPGALKGIGLIRFRQGAMAEACRMLMAAKQQLPADDEVAVALAQGFLELGFIGDCRKELLAVLDRTPAHGDALLMLAESSFIPKAMTECEERIAAAKTPDKAPVLLASALLELRRGQLEAGSKLVERAVAADPKFARAIGLQGSIFRMRKEPEKALEFHKKAAELAGPRSVEAGLYAKLLADLGRKDEAVASLKQATEAAPDYLPNWRLLAQFSIASKNDAEAAEYLSKVLAKNPLDMDAAALQAEIWIRQKEATKAVELLENVTKTFPSRPQLELPLGKAYLAAGEVRKATEALDRTLAVAPRMTQAVLLRATIDLAGSQAAEAIKRLEPLLAAEPGNRMAQDLLVQAYRATDRGDEAVAILRKQVEAAPKDLALQLRLGQFLVSQKKLVEARATFNRALENFPDNLAFISQLVAIDEQEGKPAEAMARADAFLAAHPDSAPGHLLKAGLCFIQKDFQTAESLAQKTIELNPQDMTAYGILVRILLDGGRSEQAIVRLQELLKTSPNNIPARMQLSLLLEKLGRIDEAVASYGELVKAAPEFAPAYNNLACIHSEHTGDLDKALENAKKAHSLAPQAAAIGDTLGWVQWRRGNYREALGILLEAAGEMSQAATAQYHLAMAHYMLYQTREALAALEKALAVKEGEFPEKAEAERRLAILREGSKMDLASLEEQVKKDPKDVVLQVLLAQKLAAAGRAEDALAAFQKALAIHPEIEAAQLGLAELYAGPLQQPDKALEAANQARKLAPQSSAAAAILGAMNFRLGKHQEAFALLQEAARQAPDEPRIQADYAWAAYSTGRIEDARGAMGKVGDSDPARATEARDFLALTAPNAVGDPTTPALIEKCLAAKPDHVPALMARAALLEKAGESPVATYSKVLEIYPEFNPVRLVLARAYLDDPAKLDEVEKLANAAREQLQGDPELNAVLAVVSYRRGKFDYAAQLLQELSLKRPLTGRELFALGMSQAASKRTAEALKSLTQALETKLPEADAAAAKLTLEKLTNPEAHE